MNIMGIVAEYNPFHNGHRQHIEESRKILGQDVAAVCVMSGDFVQRGDFAVFSKYARAEAAILGGADLVLELPLPWCMLSAEGFARGAVGLLGELRCVDYISFGSECGDVSTLNALAQALIDPAMDAAILAELDEGISYAAARQKALEGQIGQMAQNLEQPNNILAVEYIKALIEQRLTMEPITVKRVGSQHDEPGGSASELRAMLETGRAIDHHVPRECAAVYAREIRDGRGPVTMDNLESALLSRLRIISPAGFNSVPDAAEGLGNRLYAAAREEASFAGVVSAAKSKRYALSRIRRMTMCAALGITSEMAEGLPPYARVLAANERGRAALRTISEKASIPIITKPATIRDAGYECENLFAMNSSAHDLYVLGCSAREERRGGSDWRRSPAML